jgi:hypothetical protein
VGDAEEHRFDGDGNLAFHFFRGPRWILGDHFDQRGRGVRIGFDIQAQKHEEAAQHPGNQQDNHQRTKAQQGCDQVAHSG